MTKKVIYSTLASSLLLASSTIAGEVSSVTIPAPETTSIGGFETSIATGYHSKYIWRGLDFENDMVDASIETTGSVAGLDLTAGIWHAHVFDQQGGAFKNETDFYVDVSKDLGFVTASVGYIYYYFDADDAQEVYFGLSKDIAGISTSLTYYWDIEIDNQGYLELGLEKTVSPYEIDLSVTAGYLVEEGALSHLTSTVSKSFDLGYGISASPYVSYVVELDDLEAYAGTSEQNEFVGGVSFSYTF